MARKTSVDKTPIEKAIDAAVTVPAEEKKVELKTVKAVEAVKEEKKAPVRKAPVKKAPVAKKELKSEITVQYAGKSYSQEELIKIAKDVWRFDLKQKAADLVSVELYVKPEENMVYYVFNGTECGGFSI